MSAHMHKTPLRPTARMRVIYRRRSPRKVLPRRETSMERTVRAISLGKADMVEIKGQTYEDIYAELFGHASV